jgi:hypothetical protein
MEYSGGYRSKWLVSAYCQWRFGERGKVSEFISWAHCVTVGRGGVVLSQYSDKGFVKQGQQDFWMI